MQILDELEDNDVLVRLRKVDGGIDVELHIVGDTAVEDIPIEVVTLFNAVGYLSENAPLPLVYMMAHEQVKNIQVEDDKPVSHDMRNVVRFNVGKTSSVDG